MLYQILADAILIIHALFIVFVVASFILIMTRMFKHWSWIRNLWFRLTHLLAIGIVVTESWFEKICPFTEWENSLREAAGGAGYTGSFIQHWLQKIVFYDFSPWVFTMAYTIFGILVILAWIFIPPRFSPKKEDVQ